MNLFLKLHKAIYRAAAVIAVIAITVCLAANAFADDGSRSEDIQAADLDTYTYGLIGYTLQDLLSRNLTKKSVAYVTQIINGSGGVVADGDVVKGSFYRYALVEGVNTLNPAAAASYGCLGGITYDFFSEADPVSVLNEPTEDDRKINYYIVTADTLMDADVIVTVGCASMTAMIDSFGNREYKGVLISDVPSAFAEEGDGAKAVSVGYYLGCAYSEILNPIDLCAFYYEYFSGLTNGTELKEKVDSVFAQTSFFRGYSNKLGQGYSPRTVQEMLRKGTWFYLDNSDLFSQGAFETNGMSSWNPDVQLEGSLLDRANVIELANPVPEETTTEAPSETTETPAGTSAEGENKDTAAQENASETAETDADEEDGNETLPDTAPGEDENGLGSSNEERGSTEAETEAAKAASEEESTEAEDAGGLPSWVGPVVAAVVFAAAIVIFIIYIKKKKQPEDQQ